jgi:hypothetical protein
MWTPNITTPVVKMLCHRGPVKAVAVDPTGHQMVTAGKRREEVTQSPGTLGSDRGRERGLVTQPHTFGQG